MQANVSKAPEAMSKSKMALLAHSYIVTVEKLQGAAKLDNLQPLAGLQKHQRILRRAGHLPLARILNKPKHDNSSKTQILTNASREIWFDKPKIIIKAIKSLPELEPMAIVSESWRVKLAQPHRFANLTNGSMLSHLDEEKKGKREQLVA
jgi:hypothetical protein